MMIGRFIEEYLRESLCKHKPVQPFLIQTKMEQLLGSYQNNTEHMITKLARFHIEFEEIYPFIDGMVAPGVCL